MSAPAQGLNGEIAFQAKDVTIGYVPGTPYGYKRDLKVTAEVRMEYLTRQDTYETTSHKRVSRPLDFAITTAVWQPSGRDWTSGGATLEPLAEITRYAPGWDAGKVAELIKLGQHHLNGMTAGCDHQEIVWEHDRYGRRVPSLDRTPACPVTGYRYGHAWLVRELPEGFLARIRALFGATS